MTRTTTTIPARPGVVVGPSYSGTTTKPVYIETHFVGHYGADKRFYHDVLAVGRTGRTGPESEAHEIARRLHGHHFADWQALRDAIKAQEKWFCEAHGESDSYHHCDECAALA